MEKDNLIPSNPKRNLFIEIEEDNDCEDVDEEEEETEEDEDEGADSVEVKYRTKKGVAGVRTFSKKVHGPDFKKLAKKFAKGHPMS